MRARKRYIAKMMKCDVMPRKDEAPFLPIVMTLIVFMGWAILMLLHVLFWSEHFNLFQNIVILVLSLVIVGCALGIPWMYWIFKRERREETATPTTNPES